MSDALSKDDAENVLISLRRLVADHAPPPPTGDRFLLTPALRVVDTPKPVTDTVPAPVYLHDAAALGERLDISKAVARSLHPAPAPAPVRGADETNDSVADDASIARLLRSLARSEAPAILAQTLAQSCDQSVTEVLSPPAPANVTPHIARVMPPVPATPHATAAPVQSTVADGGIPSTALADEAFLRDIVADVLRQELQGELGERITRNMRKLVRREINRALSQLDHD